MGRLRIIPRIAILCFLLILVGIGAVPGYLTGHWSWAQPPQVANIKALRELRETGLELPGWKTLDQKVETLGGHKWSIQEIAQDQPKPVRLLLLPQNDYKMQPEVEWMDVNEFEQWQTDSHTKLQLVVESSFLGKLTTPPTKVEASFFRAWNRQQTVAVLQWYAWLGGGNPAPSQWFWRDQFAQLRRNRVPWVAVCLEIPIEPLGDIEVARPSAESLGKLVQTILMAGPLAKVSSS